MDDDVVWWVWDEDESVDREDLWRQGLEARRYRRSLPDGDPRFDYAYEIEAELFKRAQGYRPARPGELNEWGERMDPNGPV